jgi:hypothetical protein
MDLVKLGFLKYASECGVSEPQALHLWKRALDYPGTEQVFKNLNTSSPPLESSPTPVQENPEDLDMLSKLMEQEKVNTELQQIKQQLGI